MPTDVFAVQPNAVALFFLVETGDEVEDGPRSTAQVSGGDEEDQEFMDAETAAALVAMGVVHVSCPAEDVRVDPQRPVVSTPAYMLAGRISEAASGIEKLVKELLALSTRSPQS